jgi:LysR family transcriptional activator of mexEF-oprN operon
MVDTRRLDLNLLLAFEALMRTRSVTRAGEALGLGQPATSAALKRLRELTGDPLFVRGRSGLDPTPRAEALAVVVSRALADLRDALTDGRPFQPDTEPRVFRIAAPDTTCVAVLTGVRDAILSVAPRVQIIVEPLDKVDVAVRLESGAVDIALGHFADLTGPLKVRKLYADSLVVLFDPDACRASVPISLDDFCRLPHFMMTARGDLDGVVDATLAKLGRTRKVIVAVPYFLALPFLLHASATIACVPKGMAEACANVTRLAVSPAPVELPAVEISMVWSARKDRDPALVWLRERLIEAARDR